MKTKIILVILISFICLYSEFEKILITADREETGIEIFHRMKNSLGEVENINNIQTLGTVTQTVSESLITIPVEVVVEFPDKLYLHLEDKEFIISGNKGWIQYEKGYFEVMQASQRTTLLGNLNRNLIYLIKQEKDLTILFQDYIFIEDVEYAELLLKHKEMHYTLLIDIDSYLPHKLIYNTASCRGDDKFERVYVDFKEVENIKIPVHTITYDEQGSLISENIISELKINIQIDPDLF